MTAFIQQEAISAAFNAASQYADTFEVFREFYRENESLDLEAVKRQDHGTLFQFLFSCLILSLPIHLLFLCHFYSSKYTVN